MTYARSFPTENSRPIAPERAAPRYLARNLTQGGNTAQIDLDGKIYTLRITRAGKLILTK